MDFHEMKRPALQVLCKKHGIPANLTNREMADRLALLLKENEKPLDNDHQPCSNNLGKIHIEIDSKSKVVNQKVTKKVRFSPENETFLFVSSETESDSDPGYNTKRRLRKRKSMSNLESKKQVKISKNVKKAHVSTKSADNSVRNTRSRVRRVVARDAEMVFSPLAGNKRGRTRTKDADVCDKPQPTADLGDKDDPTEEAKSRGGSIRLQLRSKKEVNVDGEKAENGDSAVLRKNLTSRGSKSTREVKASDDGVVLQDQIHDEDSAIAVVEEAKPEKILKRSKRNMAKDEGSGALSEDLGETTVVGRRVTRSRKVDEKEVLQLEEPAAAKVLQLDKGSGASSEDLGETNIIGRRVTRSRKFDEKQVLQLEEPDAKAPRWKSNAPQNGRVVRSESLASKHTERGQQVKGSRKRSRKIDSEGVSEVEPNVGVVEKNEDLQPNGPPRRSRRSIVLFNSVAIAVGELITQGNDGKKKLQRGEPLESIANIAKPPRRSSRNTSKVVGGTERKIDSEGVSEVEPNVGIVTTNEDLQPNGPPRRSRRSIASFNSVATAVGELITQDNDGKKKLQRGEPLDSDANIAKPPRRSSRNASKVAGGTEVEPRKLDSGVSEIEPNVGIVTTNEDLQPNGPPRRSRRSIATFNSVATAVGELITQDNDGMKKLQRGEPLESDANIAKPPRRPSYNASKVVGGTKVEQRKKDSEGVSGVEPIVGILTKNEDLHSNGPSRRSRRSIASFNSVATAVGDLITQDTDGKKKLQGEEPVESDANAAKPRRRSSRNASKLVGGIDDGVRKDLQTQQSKKQILKEASSVTGHEPVSKQSLRSSRSNASKSNVPELADMKGTSAEKNKQSKARMQITEEESSFMTSSLSHEKLLVVDIVAESGDSRNNSDMCHIKNVRERSNKNSKEFKGKSAESSQLTSASALSSEEEVTCTTLDLADQVLEGMELGGVSTFQQVQDSITQVVDNEKEEIVEEGLENMNVGKKIECVTEHQSCRSSGTRSEPGDEYLVEQVLEPVDSPSKLNNVISCGIISSASGFSHAYKEDSNGLKIEELVMGEQINTVSDKVDDLSVGDEKANAQEDNILQELDARENFEPDQEEPIQENHLSGLGESLESERSSEKFSNEAEKISVHVPSKQNEEETVQENCLSQPIRSHESEKRLEKFSNEAEKIRVHVPNDGTGKTQVNAATETLDIGVEKVKDDGNGIARVAEDADIGAEEVTDIQLGRTSGDNNATAPFEPALKSQDGNQLEALPTMSDAHHVVGEKCSNNAIEVPDETIFSKDISFSKVDGQVCSNERTEEVGTVIESDSEEALNNGLISASEEVLHEDPEKNFMFGGSTLQELDRTDEQVAEEEKQEISDGCFGNVSQDTKAKYEYKTDNGIIGSLIIQEEKGIDVDGYLCSTTADLKYKKATETSVEKSSGHENEKYDMEEVEQGPLSHFTSDKLQDGKECESPDSLNGVMPADCKREASNGTQMVLQMNQVKFDDLHYDEITATELIESASCVDHINPRDGADNIEKNVGNMVGDFYFKDDLSKTLKKDDLDNTTEVNLEILDDNLSDKVERAINDCGHGGMQNYAHEDISALTVLHAEAGAEQIGGKNASKKIEDDSKWDGESSAEIKPSVYASPVSSLEDKVEMVTESRSCKVNEDLSDARADMNVDDNVTRQEFAEEKLEDQIKSTIKDGASVDAHEGEARIDVHFSPPVSATANLDNRASEFCIMSEMFTTWEMNAIWGDGEEDEVERTHQTMEEPKSENQENNVNVEENFDQGICEMHFSECGNDIAPTASDKLISGECSSIEQNDATALIQENMDSDTPMEEQSWGKDSFTSLHEARTNEAAEINGYNPLFVEDTEGESIEKPDLEKMSKNGVDREDRVIANNITGMEEEGNEAPMLELDSTGANSALSKYGTEFSKANDLAICASDEIMSAGYENQGTPNEILSTVSQVGELKFGSFEKRREDLSHLSNCASISSDFCLSYEKTANNEENAVKAVNVPSVQVTSFDAETKDNEDVVPEVCANDFNVHLVKKELLEQNGNGPDLSLPSAHGSCTNATDKGGEDGILDVDGPPEVCADDVSDHLVEKELLDHNDSSPDLALLRTHESNINETDEGGDDDIGRIGIDNVEDGTKLDEQLTSPCRLNNECLLDEKMSAFAKSFSITPGRHVSGSSKAAFSMCNFSSPDELSVGKEFECHVYSNSARNKAKEIEITSEGKGFGHKNANPHEQGGNENRIVRTHEDQKTNEGRNDAADGFAVETDARTSPLVTSKQLVGHEEVLELASPIDSDDDLERNNLFNSNCIDDSKRISRETGEGIGLHDLENGAVSSGLSNDFTGFGNGTSMLKPEMNVECSAVSPLTASRTEDKPLEIGSDLALFTSFELNLFSEDREKDEFEEVGVRTFEDKLINNSNDEENEGSETVSSIGEFVEQHIYQEQGTVKEVIIHVTSDEKNMMDEINEPNEVRITVESIQKESDDKCGPVEELEIGKYNHLSTSDEPNSDSGSVQKEKGDVPVSEIHKFESVHFENHTEAAEIYGSSFAASVKPRAECCASDLEKPENHVNSAVEGNASENTQKFEAHEATSPERQLTESISRSSMLKRKSEEVLSIPRTPKNLHKIYDMKENFHTSRKEQVNNMTATKTSVKRRALEELLKN